MNTSINTLASLLGAAIWADGDFTEVERVTAEEIAEAFDIPAKDFQKYITAALLEIKDLDEEKVTDYVVKHAGKVDPEESGEIFETLMHMMLCDGVLTAGEVHNLITVAEALDIDIPTAILLLCDMVKTEPDLEISFEQDED